MGAPCPRDFVVDNCSVAARMIIDYGDLREKIRAAKKMRDAYDSADDALRCYDLAIKTLREQYLSESLPGETVAQWIARKKSRRILENSCQKSAFTKSHKPPLYAIQDISKIL